MNQQPPKTEKVKIFIGEHNIVEVSIYGRLTREEVIDIREKILGLGPKPDELAVFLDGHREGLKILVDVSQMKGISFQAMTEGGASISAIREFSKVAIIRLNFLFSILGELVITFFGIAHKLRFFKTKEAALQWLKE